MIRTAMVSLIVLLSSCITFPKLLSRGACHIEELCLRMTFEECLAARGEYAGDGSDCQTPTILESTPLYLDDRVIYSVGGAVLTVFAVWARRKRLGVK